MASSEEAPDVEETIGEQVEDLLDVKNVRSEWMDLVVLILIIFVCVAVPLWFVSNKKGVVRKRPYKPNKNSLEKLKKEININKSYFFHNNSQRRLV